MSDSESSDSEESKKEDFVPKVGDHLYAKWRDDKLYEVEVLETKEQNNKTLYYVHFSEFNRRLDQWVTKDSLSLYDKKKRKRHHGDSISYSKSGKSSKTSKTSKTSKSTKKSVNKSDKDKNITEEERHFEQVYRVRNFDSIKLGENSMDVWYFSPFPKQYSDEAKDGILYICEFCLKATPSKFAYDRHCSKCLRRNPPGQEIYRNDNLSFFEVDGAIETDYCRNLCLISKFFLDHKTLYYDVDLFLFYVLCNVDNSGFHIVGYFSKEKDSQDGYNLACILTLPAYQRMGFGHVLINFSYELSKRENKIGSPEKPLSDLGLLSYRSYWGLVLVDLLKQYKEISVEELSGLTSFLTEDIITTLKAMDVIKYSKGQYVFSLTSKMLREHEQLKQKVKQKPIDPSKLKWTPIDWSEIKMKNIKRKRR